MTDLGLGIVTCEMMWDAAQGDVAARTLRTLRIASAPLAWLPNAHASGLADILWLPRGVVVLVCVWLAYTLCVRMTRTFGRVATLS